MKFLYRKFKVVYHILAALLIKVYLIFCSIFKRDTYVVDPNNNEDVIVSLTSYYKRFPTLKWTLESLMQQKTKYKFKLVLVLSQEDIDKYGKTPEYLKSYEKRGLKVLVVNENIRSYKKAFYTYDVSIPMITTDDDVYYPSWWLEGLMVESEKTPNMVLAYRGHYILSKSNHFFPYVEWMKWSEKNFIAEAKYSLLPTGTSGIYYPLGALKGLKESKNEFLEICPNADDFWFKYLTVINGFKARRIMNNNIHFLLMSKGESLFDINVEASGNDEQFKKLIKYDEKIGRKLLLDVVEL